METITVHQKRENDQACPTVKEREGKIIIHIPMTFKKRGGRKEIVLPPGCLPNDDLDGPSINKPLAVAVALGCRWLDLLMEGKIKIGSASELAETVNVDPSHLRRHLNLACLSPKLTKAIFDGKEPSGMSLEKLREVQDRWEEQENISWS